MKITLKNVNYIYSPKTPYETAALQDINLEISSDEGIISVVGSTGCGKSTLAQIMCALLEPTDGAISWEFGDFSLESGCDKNSAGHRSNDKNPEYRKKLRRIRQRVGMVFQYPEHQLFGENVLTDVMFGPKNKGLLAEDAERAAKEALKLLGMGEEYFIRSPFELSGGEMRRAAIAGVLAMEPEILVLDEPTAGLDPAGCVEILDLLRKLSEVNSVGIIMISHNMDEVAGYANRVIAMDAGRIVLDGGVREVFAQYEELKKIGLGEPDVTMIMRKLRGKSYPVILTVDEAFPSDNI